MLFFSLRASCTRSARMVTSTCSRTRASSKSGSAWPFCLASLSASRRRSSTWSATSSWSTLMSHMSATLAWAKEMRSSFSAWGRAISLYLRKPSRVIMDLISSSEVPEARKSESIWAKRSLAFSSTSVSGTSHLHWATSISSRAPPSCFLAARSASSFTAMFTSLESSSMVRPSRISLAKSSLHSGSVREATSMTSTSKMALRPRMAPAVARSGNSTSTWRVSPAVAPTSASTRPGMKRSCSMMSSMALPSAMFGSASPLLPSAASSNSKPAMFTVSASPMAAPPSLSAVLA
mmetsp:Transcript_30409/g.97025  ORF Transcript_30409/g.97025 Transcript_30409/m.97025 type:complete len:292 (-) Transcript_30409:521-1396(-)